MLKDIQSYLSVRRALGYRLQKMESHLLQFAQYALARNETHVRASTAIEWAATGCSPGVRARRLQSVTFFARYAHAEDARHEVPPSGIFSVSQHRRVPFIFSPAEVQQLVTAASHLPPPGSLRPATYSTLFALLACTGIRISEAINLRLCDVAPEGLFIRQTKFNKSRWLPLHPTAVAGLQRYLVRRRREAGGDDHFFVSLYGGRLHHCNVHTTFHQLLQSLGFHALAGRPKPHLHDLRHTFAVRALESCHQDRDHVAKHMLALSTYLGHAHVAHTYWYLDATPQLMGDITAACQAYVQGAHP